MTILDPEVLGIGLMFVFGWNNGPVLLGNLAGSGILSYRRSLALVAAGLLAGVFLEGPKMERSLAGGITSSTTQTVAIEVLILSFTIMLLLSVLRIPVSLGNILVGAYSGASLAAQIPLNSPQILLILLSWLSVPAFSALITILIYRIVSIVVPNWSLITLDTVNRAAVLGITFYVAFAMGANNLGMVRSVLAPFQHAGIEVQAILFSLAALMGMLLFGRGISGVIGDELLALSPVGVLTAMFGGASVMLLLTQFRIPVSITQAIVGGMVGVSLTRDVRVINRRILGEILASWILVTGFAFVLALALFTAF